MELRHLRYFVAVAEELNFRRAAQRVRVAQPALSKQIKDLEYEVGVRLLERNTAGVALTDAGSVFLSDARAIIEKSYSAILAARDADAGKIGSLNIANVGVISASFMPAALSAFRGRYPDVDVNLHEMAVPDQIAAIEIGRIQVGFAVDPGTKFPAHLEVFRALESEIAVAVSKEHPLARMRAISVQDLAGERILCFETGAVQAHRKRIAAIFTNRGAKPGRLKFVNSLESLQAMIEGNQGISFLAASRNIWRGNELVFRPLKERGPDLRFVVLALVRKNRPSQLALNFVDVLRTVCTHDGRSAAA